MNDLTHELSSIRDWADQMLATLVANLPSLIGAILVVVIGWVFAVILRSIARRIFRWANLGLDSVFRRDELASTHMSARAVRLLSAMVFWLVILAAITIAARMAGFVTISTWLDQIVSRLPSFIIGAAIIVIGYVLSAVVGEQVSTTARAARSGQSAALGRIAQSVILVATLIIGLDQIGIDVTFLVALFSVATGAIFVGFSLAFGLGARDFVGDLVGARDISRALKPGLNVRVGDQEGEVLEITPTRLVLNTDIGRVMIAGQTAARETVIILSSEDAGEDQNV